ncbi:MAG: glycosyltransferase family 2 protein [Myxococcota bacterium]|jgi:glycosyltransferase involved in cell wall biosynthesis|nr:glycosyltransferase family 2 protein [Myxococcota bacterium]
MAVRSLSIVLPAFNEAENIRESIHRSVTVCERLSLDFEVVVVDDGSNDATARLATNAALENPRVRILSHERNRGYGAALKSGIHASRKEYIFFTDADLQFDLEELEGLLQSAGEFDIIAGYRKVRSDPFARRFNAWAWGQLMGLLFELNIRDVDCAFKVFHRSVFDRVPIHSVGAFVNTEILVRARAQGFSLRQVPVSHYPRHAGRQTGADLKVIVKAFRELGRLHSELRREQIESVHLEQPNK